MNKISEQTVVVAMSGGVDSSVAAVLLKEQGFRVIGITMQLWDYEKVGGNINNAGSCCSIHSFNDARLVCSALGINHYILNLSDRFYQEIVQDFIDEYLAGRTPNPCVQCNAKIKWKILAEKSKELGAGYLATGHYARLNFNQGTNRYELSRARDHRKDQSYALWGIDQANLAHTLFPLGQLTKPQVRAIAQKYNLATADKKESQEICFIPDNDYGRLLRDKTADLGKGEMVYTDGTIIGSHRGYPFYTIGQRRGLGGGFKEPMYVVGIDPLNNRITVGNDDALYGRELLVERINWVSIGGIDQPCTAQIKIRYNDTFHSGALYPMTNGEIKVIMEKPVRAITPGQSAVFYRDELVLGGGIIKIKLA